jgi:hypothetical protein
MTGIVEGLLASGVQTDIHEIIAWNYYCSIPYWFSSKSEGHVSKEGGASDKCSAFIAVGDWTENGDIVVAHNSFCDFIDGQFANIVLCVQPTNGHQFIMQTSPCWVWSGTDFFITSKGIIGTETTIGGFHAFELKAPIGYRIRKAMQYGNTLDDYVEILKAENSGDYANSWLFGDINTKEIMRFELGLRYFDVARTTNGCYIGFNAPYNEQIRNFEVNNSGFYDIRRHQGARMVRLGDLMDLHKGKINLNIAKKIIADHYDVYLERENPCSRTICSHYDMDAREYMSQESRPKPYAPRGAVDGIVADTNGIKRMEFVAIFGNSCGMEFDSALFFKKHRQYEKFKDYVKSRPSQPWTSFRFDQPNIQFNQPNIQKINPNTLQQLPISQIKRKRFTSRRYNNKTQKRSTRRMR